MKTKRSFKQSTKQKQKQKLTWYYVAAGVAIGVFVGIGVFFYMNLGTGTDTLAAGGQGYTSHNNYISVWDDASSWTKDKSWMNDVPSYTGGYSQYIDVYGLISREGDLTIANGTTININDTLWIKGSLTFSDKALNIEPNGVLIVEGDFITDGGAKTKNNGRVVVLGDLNASGGAKFTNNNDFYVFGTSTATGGTKFNGSKNNPSNSNIGGDEDLAADDGGLYNFALGGGGSLPVEFHFVKAEKSGSTIKVSWATASELNNDFFTVEKARDGKNFEAIGTVGGAGNSNTLLKYVFVDTGDQNGTQYYRIKQTDFDGQFDYSKIVSVSNSSGLDTQNNSISIVTVGPNPFQDMFTVDFETSVPGPVEVSLMNLNGAIVASDVIEGNEGSNRYTFNDDRGLEKGVYLLRLSQQNTVSKAVRIIKR